MSMNGCVGLLTAAPLAALSPQGLLCDFCACPVSHYFTVPCPDFKVFAQRDIPDSDSVEDIPLFANDGAYCACLFCSALVQARSYESLIVRVLESLPDEVRGDGHGLALYESMLRTVYSCLFRVDLRQDWMEDLPIHFDLEVDISIE